LQKKKIFFPKRFYAASALVVYQPLVFKSRLILVKHFFYQNHREYALLSWQKNIFFFGSLFNDSYNFMFQGYWQKVNPNKTFYKFLWIIIGITAVSYVGIGLLGSFFMPIAFGDKSIYLPYLRDIH